MDLSRSASPQNAPVFNFESFEQPHDNESNQDVEMHSSLSQSQWTFL